MQLTVSQKINLGGAIFAVTVLVILVGMLIGRTTLVETLERTKTRSAMTDSLNRLQFHAQELISYETDYILTQDIADYDNWSDALQRLLNAVDEVDGLLHATQTDTPQLQAILDDFVLAQFEYKEAFLRIHGSIRRAAQEGRALDLDTIQSFHGNSLRMTRVTAGVMIESAGEMVSLNQQMVARDSRDAISAVGRIELLVAVLAALGILTAIAMHFLAVRTISRPLAMLTANSQKMAKGQFDLDLDIHSDDEIGKLARSLQEMAEDLGSLYGSLEHKVNERTAELARVNANLARSNAELEQFAYVASHDLQEPLRTISGFAELLARRYQGKLDEKADGYIRFLTQGATRMQELVQALLAYSRIGAEDIPFQDVDCGALVNEVLISLDASIKKVGATITVDSLPTVPGERTQLAQLFQNLIANALKFHASEPLRIHIAAEPEDGVWRFSLQDNGIGMEPRHTKRIFVIFQRLQTREEYAGTGIGLAVCKKVVERHGGRIWVESQPGHGSTFYWTLPMHNREREQAS